jgi:hypothetical protein
MSNSNSDRKPIWILVFICLFMYVGFIICEGEAFSKSWKRWVRK